MARTLSVKVPTALLIAQIEQSIAKIDADVEAYSGLRKQYEADVKQYEKDVIYHALNALSNPDNIGTADNSLVRVTNNHYRNAVSVEFDTEALGFPKKPTEPTRPNQKEYFGREYVSRKELLEKNLRILRMTSQEEVSASSYSSVIDFI
jgi:hypothetical protein